MPQNLMGNRERLTDIEDEEKDDMGNWKYAAKGLMNKSKSDRLFLGVS